MVASKGRSRLSGASVALVLLLVSGAITWVGASLLSSTLHARARVEGECTVLERRFVRGRFGRQSLTSVDLRVRLDVEGKSYASREWVRFDGGRPDPGSKVVCYHDPRDPEDVAFWRPPWSGEVPLLLFGVLFDAVSVFLLLAVLDADEAWHRLRARWRRRAPPAAPVAASDPAPGGESGEAPYRAAAPLAVRAPVRLKGVPIAGQKHLPWVPQLGCMSVPLLFMVSLVVSDARPWVGVVLWSAAVVATLLPLLWTSRLRARRRLPAVEVDGEPAQLGDALEVRVLVRGPAQLDAATVVLECRSNGDLLLELRAVPVDEADGGGRTLLAGDTWESRWRLSLPARPDYRFETATEPQWSLVVGLFGPAGERSGRYPVRVVARA